MPTFTPPTAGRWTFGEGRVVPEGRDIRAFWNRFGAQPRGRTLIRESGVWRLVDNPPLSRVATADTITDPTGATVPGVLQGGHVHTITETVAAELTAAGYGGYLT